MILGFLLSLPAHNKPGVVSGPGNACCRVSAGQTPLLTVPLLTVMGNFRSSKAEGFTSTFLKLIRPDATEIDRSFESTFLQNLPVHPPTRRPIAC